MNSQLPAPLEKTPVPVYGVTPPVALTITFVEPPHVTVAAALDPAVSIEAFGVDVEVYHLALVWLLAWLALMLELVTRPRPRTAPLLDAFLKRVPASEKPVKAFLAEVKRSS